MTAEPSDPPRVSGAAHKLMPSVVVTTPSRWFARGFLVGVLVCGALNALSYFFRSDGWGNLLGVTPQNDEALGFPVKVWEAGNTYGGLFVDYPALLVCAVCAAAVGTACGLLTVACRRQLDRLVAQLEARMARDEPRVQFQFSVRGLLLATTAVALAAAVGGRALAARAEALGAIYALGPWLLVALALLPRRIPWQQRVVLIIPLTAALILVAVVVGASLRPPREFDQVLMGIFICWTPQSALAAVALTAMLLASHWHSQARADCPPGAVS